MAKRVPEGFDVEIETVFDVRVTPRVPFHLFAGVHVLSPAI